MQWPFLQGATFPKNMAVFLIQNGAMFEFEKLLNIDIDPCKWVFLVAPGYFHVGDLLSPNPF